MSKPVFCAYIETGILCRRLTTLISSRLRWISLSFETRSTVSSTCSQATSFWMLTWFLSTTRSTTCQPPQCSPRDRYSNHTFGNDLGNWNWRHCYQICLARNLPRAAVRCASERFETGARAHILDNETEIKKALVIFCNRLFFLGHPVFSGGSANNNIALCFEK